MLDAPLYPLRFEPILKELIWGGRRLETVLHKPLGEGSRYAESWEIADHRDDVSRVADGPLAGSLAPRPGPGAGRRAARAGRRPCDPVPAPGQVPRRASGPLRAGPSRRRRGRRLADDNGKTEAWVVVHAEPGSLIYAGLRPGGHAGRVRRRLETGDVEPLLHRFEAEPGDCILIPAGTVHAIGAGVVLAEIQQMSDATFRVHDWGRRRDRRHSPASSTSPKPSNRSTSRPGRSIPWPRLPSRSPGERANGSPVALTSRSSGSA